MDSFYQKIIAEIDEVIAAGSLDEADRSIENELSMPYIPPDVEKKLHERKADITYQRADSRKENEPSMDSLLNGLKGDAASQLASVSGLAGRNLRTCLAEIKNYLAGVPCPEAAVMLIDAMAEQKIAEEFTMTRDGLEYTFWGDEVIPVAESEGFQRAMAVLDDTLSREPSVLEMARSILIHDAYMALPLTFEKEEGSMLAAQATKQVRDLMAAKEKDG